MPALNKDGEPMGSYSDYKHELGQKYGGARALCASTYHGIKCSREKGHAGRHSDTDREATAVVIWGDDSADKPTTEQARALAASIEGNVPDTHARVARIAELARSLKSAEGAGESDHLFRLLAEIEWAAASLSNEIYRERLSARALREELEASHG